jgi:cytochrome c biogenesis protein CcmG, thiol:disulfide interchange protein DsbE
MRGTWYRTSLALVLCVTMSASAQSQLRKVGRPVPRFVLSAAVSTNPGLGSGSFFEGQPKLLNLFASWCVPCASESKSLMKIARLGVPIDAVAVRDTSGGLARFLGRYGNPYRRIGADLDGRVQAKFGSAEVPQTFVIDGRGVIRFQHVGDIQDEDIPDLLVALRAARFY